MELPQQQCTSTSMISIPEASPLELTHDLSAVEAGMRLSRNQTMDGYAYPKTYQNSGSRRVGEHEQQSGESIVSNRGRRRLFPVSSLTKMYLFFTIITLVYIGLTYIVIIFMNNTFKLGAISILSVIWLSSLVCVLHYIDINVRTYREI